MHIEKQPTADEKSRRAARSLAGFDFQALNRAFLAPEASESFNRAAHYGVTVLPAQSTPGQPYWKVIGLYHLSPDENNRRHNAFIETLDESGARVQNPALRVGWIWEGKNDGPAEPKALDKPADEPATDIPLEKNMTVTLWLEGDGASEQVAGLHARHADEPGGEGSGNSWGHHSFYIVFQRARAGQAPGDAHGDGAESNGDHGAAEDHQTPTSRVDDAAYVPGSDWIQDDTRLPAGHPFAQSWQMTNRGTTTWSSGYRCVFVDGHQLGAPEWVEVPACAPGQTVRLTIPFVAPQAVGAHQSNWRLVNPAGEPFGQRFWTRVVVTPVVEVAAAGETVLAPQADRLFNLTAIADQTARVVASTWNRYGGLLEQEANRLGIEPAVAVATLVAESRGDAFGADGRMIIRFENHIFYDLWGKQNQPLFHQHFQMDATTPWLPSGHKWRPNVNEAWRACHTSQETEWRVFALAQQLNADAAMQSISMGAPQVMGFNHAKVGYATVQEMFGAFQANVANQIRSLFRFMEVNRLVDAVRSGDYREFARVYNGPGQMDEYARLIENYVTSFRSLVAAQGVGRAAVVPRPMPEPELMTRMPLPPSSKPGLPLSEADPELYAAWREHMKRGFDNNQTMFEQILAGFMNPYWSTVWMYRILFGVGIGAFLAALLVALMDKGAATTAIFGGLSVAAFLTYFLNRPLQALEENLQFITWLGIIYNSYWSRLAYLSDLEKVQGEVDSVTDETIAKIEALMEKHAERSRNRPNVT